MRCIICLNTFRTPSPNMREDQICSQCRTNRNVIQKEDHEYRKKERDTLETQKNLYQNKLIKISNEIEKLENNMQILQNLMAKKDREIKIEQKRNQSLSFGGLVNKMFGGNKLLNDLKKSLSEKILDLENIHSELVMKRSERNECRIQIEECIKKKPNMTPGQKAAITRLENYRKASPKEKAKIDEKRHQAAIKARENREPKSTDKEKLKENKEISQRNSNKNRLDVTLSDIERFVNSKNMSNTQPYTSVLKKFVNIANQFPDESFTKIFQSRFRLGIRSANTVKNQRSIIQNFEDFLKPQYSKMSQVISKQILDSGESTNKKQNIDEINQLISEALIIIRKNSSGVHKKILEQKLMMTEEEFEKFLPKLLRIEDIVEEDDGHSNVFLKSIENNDERVIQEQSTDVEKIRNEIKELKKRASERIEKEKIEREHAPEIEKITMKMIQNHLHWKRNISKELKRKVISEFVEFRSLTKIYDLHPNDTAERIRSHIITDLRLPSELKKLENEGAMHPNLVCSLAIALYATDYFHWDGKKEDEGKIIDLAKSISKYLKSDEYINQLFQGKKIHNN